MLKITSVLYTATKTNVANTLEADSGDTNAVSFDISSRVNNLPLIFDSSDI